MESFQVSMRVSSVRLIWDLFCHCRQLKLIRWSGLRKCLFLFVDCKADREQKVHTLRGKTLQISSFAYLLEGTEMLM